MLHISCLTRYPRTCHQSHNQGWSLTLMKLHVDPHGHRMLPSMLLSVFFLQVFLRKRQNVYNRKPLHSVLVTAFQLFSNYGNFLSSLTFTIQRCVHSTRTSGHALHFTPVPTSRHHNCLFTITEYYLTPSFPRRDTERFRFAL